ncbi:hypothetical protein E2320_016159 [Naja naja]|nr:hypothetical protein E2320_016159 [Naja naja]
MYWKLQQKLNVQLDLGLLQTIIRFLAKPSAVHVDIQDSGPRRAQPNAILEKVFTSITKCPDTRRLEGLSKQLDWDVRKIQRWFRHRRNQDKPSTFTKFCESIHHGFGMYDNAAPDGSHNIAGCWGPLTLPKSNSDAPGAIRAAAQTANPYLSNRFARRRGPLMLPQSDSNTPGAIRAAVQTTKPYHFDRFARRWATSSPRAQQEAHYSHVAASAISETPGSPYLQQRLFLSCFLSIQDFFLMFVHHVAAVTLIICSYISKMVRIGTLILCLHDSVDNLLELAKLFNYAKYQRLCDATFVLFGVVFLITRLGIFPIWILNSTMFESWEIIGPYPSWWFFNSLLLILQVLHIIWSYFIIRIAYKAMARGKVSRDERSDVESSSEDDDVTSNNRKGIINTSSNDCNQINGHVISDQWAEE